MVIQYFGDECFRLQSGEFSILVNPTNNRLKGDIVIKTISPTDAVPEAGELIYPGEYEIRGIEIQGFQVATESTATFVKTVYVISFEDMKLVLLGHISDIPTGEWLESLVEPDVLFVPTGEHFIKPTEAAEFAKKMEPAIIIPSYRGNPDAFLKAMGEKAEKQEKLTFKKKDLADKKSHVVVLEAK